MSTFRIAFACCKSSLDYWSGLIKSQVIDLRKRDVKVETLPGRINSWVHVLRDLNVKSTVQPDLKRIQSALLIF